MISFVKGKEEIEEIPRRQRYIERPGLDSLFKRSLEITKRERNLKIVESVEKYGYNQKEVADYLGLHYSTISRLMKKD